MKNEIVDEIIKLKKIEEDIIKFTEVLIACNGTLNIESYSTPKYTFIKDNEFIDRLIDLSNLYIKEVKEKIENL